MTQKMFGNTSPVRRPLHQSGCIQVVDCALIIVGQRNEFLAPLAVFAMEKKKLGLAVAVQGNSDSPGIQQNCPVMLVFSLIVGVSADDQRRLDLIHNAAGVGGAKGKFLVGLKR